MTTVHPIRDDATTISEAILTLARDARRALQQAADSPCACAGDILAELNRRAEALRGQIGPDRLQGARRWLDALQALIVAHQAPADPRVLAGRLDERPVRIVG